jgi:hypothetical protein
MRRLAAISALIAALAVPAASPALAAANPSGRGQPSQECGSPTAMQSPPGFSSGGFAKAEMHYAGSDLNPNASGNSHAVSQYDVACFQVSQSH